MDVKEYKILCAKASERTRDKPYNEGMAWRRVPFVYYRGVRYIPMDYKYGFKCGKPRHVAILRDVAAPFSVVEALVEKVEKGA